MDNLTFTTRIFSLLPFINYNPDLVIGLNNHNSIMIEAAIMKFPLPTLYIYDNKVFRNEPIIEALFGFITNKFPLTNCKFFKEFEGFYFKDLNRSVQRRLEELSITVITINVKEKEFINLLKEILL